MVWPPRLLCLVAFSFLQAASCLCDAHGTGESTRAEHGDEGTVPEAGDGLLGVGSAAKEGSWVRESLPRARDELTRKPPELGSDYAKDKYPRSRDGDGARRTEIKLPAPTFHGEAEPLSAEVRSHMTGRSWREGCPVGLDDLMLLTVNHWDMGGEVAVGQMVVSKEVSDDVLKALESLFEQGFPIAKMRRIDYWKGDDDRSMEANNSSAFNCRYVAGTKRWSEHSFGTAIDLNPKQNPYVRGDLGAPPAGRAFLDRDDVRPGMMVPGPAVDAFRSIGWGWGGDWRSVKDYQHFSRSGR